jgi:hypothetical protein
VTAWTAVVASGARYRRPAIPNLETFEGVAGVAQLHAVFAETATAAR